MNKSGLADSPFFTTPQKKGATVFRSNASPAREAQPKGTDRAGEPQATTPPTNRDTTTPRNHDTTVSRHHDAAIEVVRKAVKEFGKEAATHRFTLAEKKAIADIIYAYKNSGIRTSENEITRIAINFIIHDYLENGEHSILDRVLRALNR
jgi:hypothetical protein